MWAAGSSYLIESVLLAWFTLRDGSTDCCPNQGVPCLNPINLKQSRLTRKKSVDACFRGLRICWKR